MNRLSKLNEHWEILSIIASLTDLEDGNGWVPYSRLRKVVTGNPSKKLEDALNHDLLVKDANNYRFKNMTLHNAIITAISSIRYH